MNPETLIVARPADSRVVAWGRVAGWAFFAIWLGAVGSGLVWFGREGCGEPMSAVKLPAGAVAPGWRMRHWLPTEHALTPLIARQLIARGPLPGSVEEIYLSDAAASGWAGRLRRAGWRVRVAEGVTVEPRIEIFGPDDSVRWSGGFRAAELDVAGAQVLDTVVFAKIARGEGVTPFVPIGCASPGERPGRVAGALGWRRFFQL